MGAIKAMRCERLAGGGIDCAFCGCVIYYFVQCESGW